MLNSLSSSEAATAGQAPARWIPAAYLRSGRFPHALLLESADSETALSVAKEIAKAALCTGEVRPCGLCRDCLKAERGSHPDILCYGGGGGARTFHIDTVREIRREAYVRPNEAERKALILRDVQEMSPQAQNALLKILEEPPKGVLFLLTCGNKAALLETVLSRVQALSLAEASAERFAPETVQLLCDLTTGSELAALTALVPYERNREDLRALLLQLRQLVCALLSQKPGLPEDARSLRDAFTNAQLLHVADVLDELAAGLDGNVSGLLLCTALCSKIRQGS